MQRTPFARDYATDMRDAAASEYLRDESPPHMGVSDVQPVAHAHGFGQAFGLHPIPAVLTLAVNAMIFGGQIVTMGALFPLALAAAAVLGFITYRSQVRFYGDDAEAARIKALAVALLTAIPVGLPAFLTVPSGVVGLVHTLRRAS